MENHEINKRFQIIFFKGGRTQIMTAEEKGRIQLEIWHLKKYVTKPVQTNNSAWICEISSNKFLSFAFKEKH